jgi:3-hydroxyisobutyrate dehydrogenase
MAQTLGFIGLGAMGAPMVRSLRRAGIGVVAYDKRAEVTEALSRSDGVQAASDAAGVAGAVDVLIAMLPTSAHLESLLFEGQDAAASSLRAGCLLIDMGSGQPATTRRIGARLAERRVQMVDAPVSGNVGRAERGDLTVMLGGDVAARERAKPWLQPMARTIYETGELGTGQAMKALNNLSSAAGFWIASEVLSAGRKLGLDPQTMLDVLNASTGANNSTQNKFEPFVLSGSFAGRFGLALMVKDLGIAAELMRSSEAHAPLAQQVQACWADALAALGSGADHTEVARFVAERSNTRLWN